MRMLSERLMNIIKHPEFIMRHMLNCICIIKMWISFILLIPFRRKMYSKDVWIVGEKGTEARDNGYHFYKYIREEHPEINAYFVISKDSSDLIKVQKYKNVIAQNSFKHYLYYLSSKVSASSQPFGAIPDPANKLFTISKKLHRKDQVIIHLKHGITKDELPHILDYSNTKFDLICCVSERERTFMQEIHGYPDDNIKTTGFCRYDNLLKEHSVKKQILIMPTHRMWLQAANSDGSANKNEINRFENTDFYKTYAALLNDKVLLECAKKEGYKIVFYPHYALQPYIESFSKFADETVIIAGRKHYDVQQLLLDSALLVTDFSSVFFDFAYMDKPVIYYQFDEIQYREKHFKKGYLDYRKDGFGPVYDHKEDVVSEIVHIINNNCVMSELYRKRVDDFFVLRDTNNCKRVFEEVYRKAMKK